VKAISLDSAVRHSLNSVIGDPNAPYLTSLARQYGEATNYYGVTHPSEPNYVAMISGSNWWTNTDNPANRFDHTNLVDELEAAHVSWGAYMQARPASDPLADYWPSGSNPLYASKRDPFVLFNDIRNDPARLADVKPYPDLPGDLNGPRAPRFVFISPDQCNDMHGGVYTAVPGYLETPCPYNTVNDDPAAPSKTRGTCPNSASPATTPRPGSPGCLCRIVRWPTDGAVPGAGPLGALLSGPAAAGHTRQPPGRTRRTARPSGQPVHIWVWEHDGRG